MTRAAPELGLHRAVADLLRLFARSTVIWWHTPNGNVGPRRGLLLKRMGVRAGVADFTIITPARGGNSCVYFVELKADKGRVSEAQSQFAQLAESANCTYWVIRDLDHAAELFEATDIITHNPFVSKVAA